MDAHPAAEVERIELASGRGEIRLEPAGLRHPRSTAFGGRCLSPWSSITDVAVGPLGMRLATLRGVFFLRRSAFREADAPERLVEAILRRIAREPGGEAQLARMASLAARARAGAPTRMSRAAALLCVAAFGVQLAWAPYADLAGVFSAPLVSAGELWRIATANLLHAGPLHLLVNTLGLLVIGGLAERSLGGAATAFVMGVSAAGAMLGSWLAAYPWALGASGVVAGLAGALVWLELRRPASLPAAWRLPRRIFVGALVVESGLLLFVPGVAHAAHAGGFVAGTLATAVAGTGDERTPRRRRGLAFASAALGVVFAAALAHATSLALARDPTLLLEAEGIPAVVLNNEAWLIAVSEHPDAGELAAALALAERAVEQTGSQDPNILDTLAEVHFAAGRIDEALGAIDRAIALAPEERYFREQRRRFTGERAADDRPEPPSEPGPAVRPDAPPEGPAPRPFEPPGPLDPGVRV